MSAGTFNQNQPSTTCVQFRGFAVVNLLVASVLDWHSENSRTSTSLECSAHDNYIRAVNNATKHCIAGHAVMHSTMLF